MKKRNGLWTQAFFVLLFLSAAIFAPFGGKAEAAVADHILTETVDPDGITVNLFDYWLTEQGEPGNRGSRDSNIGINQGHSLKFGASGGSGINGWGGGPINQGIVSALLGEDIECVFKTLVLRGDRTGHFVCVVPGGREVDLKKAAKASGNKKCELIHVRELLPLTGYIRGGCSPLGMKKPLPTYLHSTCMRYPAIYVSAGQRGLQLRLSPADLTRVTGATVCDLC